MIRPATLQDVSKILFIALGEAKAYPLRPDKDRMQKMIIEMISTKAHFSMVDEEDGEIVAVLGAMVGDNMWAQRKFASVVLWWSKKPGRGAALLRRFKAWVKERRAIRVAGFAPDLDLEPRTLLLFEKLGFTRHGGAYLYYNGVSHGTV